MRLRPRYFASSKWLYLRSAVTSVSQPAASTSSIAPPQLPPPTANFRGIVGKEPYPIGRKTGEVLRQLVLRGVERLKNLFRGNKSRSEIVATFLAVLDLCKTNSVTLEDDINGDNPNVRLLDEEEKKELIAHGT